MGQTHTTHGDPALSALRLMLKSRGLELSDTQVEKAWDTFTRVAPWLPAANLFDWSTWDRVEQLVRKREINLGEGPPLGVYPTLSSLKACFSPGPPKGGSKFPPKEPPPKEPLAPPIAFPFRNLPHSKQGWETFNEEPNPSPSTPPKVEEPQGQPASTHSEGPLLPRGGSLPPSCILGPHQTPMKALALLLPDGGKSSWRLFYDTGRELTDSNLPPPCMSFLVNAKMVVWEGMTTDHKLTCAGMKDCSMVRWIVATKDIGTQLP